MLYIHIPFCKGKCIYCDFYSSGNPDWEKYLKAVALELKERIPELKGGSLSSIYLGGGTPSLIPGRIFTSFLQSVYSLLLENHVSLPSDMEVTIEVNPEDVSTETVSAWKDAGINRVSMGVQSLNDSSLSFLKRRHDAVRALNAFQLLNKSFDNISVDVIYGIPGENDEIVLDTLTRLLSLEPKHVSAYSLTYEDRTPLVVLRNRGVVRELTEEESLAQGLLVARTLESAGYERYEISNFALPGFRSRHNSGYWDGRPYLGLGPSASSFDGVDTRRANKADIKGYLSRFNPDNNSRLKFYDEEALSLEELREERIFISLRTKEGISLDSFRKDFGVSTSQKLMNDAVRWLESGHMIIRSNSLSLTAKGIPISDYIILSLV